jgi:serine/threonine-protein kinase
VLASALAKDRRQRFASAGEFRAALAAAFGRALPARLSADHVLPPSDAPTEILHGSHLPPSNIPPSTNWDPALLLQVQASLARHVGPLAAVLVRRSARECTDLPSLYAKLAEQVTDPRARSAFISQVGSTSGSGSDSRPPTPAGSSSSGAKVALNDAVLMAAGKLLTHHVGPIASVLVKRAAAKGGNRAVFFDALQEVVSDPAARAQLRADLDRLP